MKSTQRNHTGSAVKGQVSCEILVLSDGRILAHNITPEIAALLSKLDPANTSMRSRANFLKKDQNEAAKGN